MQTVSGIPLSQVDKYPYNYVTVSQAQGLSLNVKGTSTDYTTSLLFGVQWDLICKFIEETGAKSQYEIKTNSASWGNYMDSNINYYYNNTIRNKPSGTQTLISTGSSEQTKVLNMCDLAGNVMEFTLEKNGGYCTLRGYSFEYENGFMAHYTKLDINSIYRLWLPYMPIQIK